MNSLDLLPLTTITARSGENYAQITLKNDGETITAGLSATVKGIRIGPVEKTVSSTAMAFVKAGVIGSLLSVGMDRLGAKEADHPLGLPIEIVVNDGGREYRENFALPLNLGAIAQFQQVIEMVRSVNTKAGR